MLHTRRYGSKDSANDGGSAMDVELKNIFAGDGLGRREVQDKGARVEDRRGRGWQMRRIQLAEGSVSGLGQRRRRTQSAVDVLTGWAGDANDGNCALSRGRGEGVDGRVCRQGMMIGGLERLAAVRGAGMLETTGGGCNQ